jgi:hypothetical protein
VRAGSVVSLRDNLPIYATNNLDGASSSGNCTKYDRHGASIKVRHLCHCIQETAYQRT